MLTDCVLVAAGIGLFTILAALHKEHHSLLHLVSKTAIASGGFVTTLKLILLLTDLESLLSAESSIYTDMQFSAFLISVLVNFRPLLLGIFVKLLLLPFARNEKHNTEPASTPKMDVFSPLSPREREVARLAIKGYTNAQIADELFISVETVKRHMSTIFEKLDIKNRRELMNLCTQKADNDLQ